MSAVATILLNLFIIYAAAKLAGALCRRLGQPAVIGEILVGVLIGPFALGLIVPFVMGFSFMLATEHARLESAFVATALVATSVGITARVLQELGVLRTREARIILGAAVIDDVLGLILLSI